MESIFAAAAAAAAVSAAVGMVAESDQVEGIAGAAEEMAGSGVVQVAVAAFVE